MDGQGTGPSPAARKIVEIVNLSDILINGKGGHMNPPTAEANGGFQPGLSLQRHSFGLSSCTHT